MKNLDSLYELRNKFIIIGLTGRLGSGCTTVANMLSTEQFEDCRFPEPQYSKIRTNEDRKYNIVYRFLKSNWSPYFVIRPSDIISFILLSQNIDSTFHYLESKKFDKEKLEGIKNSINNLYGDLHGEVKKIWDINTNDIFSGKEEDLFKILRDNSKISDFSKILKGHFKNLNYEKNIHPFQHFGDNIRKSGNPLNETDFDPKNCYIIAKTIHKIITKYRKENDGIARIVIDSIRNSMEARYFKEKYSSFYLFAINTEESFRKNRQSADYNNKELKELDKEYTNDLSTEEKFFRQDIQTCIQVSDIYLHNPDKKANEGEKATTLKKDLLRYLSLILQPGIITPTPEERCMQIAYIAKYNSGCISRQVGAVVTDASFSVKSIGWNNTAEGQTPCLLRNVNDLLSNSDEEAFSEYEKDDDSEYKKLLNQTFSSNLSPKNEIEDRLRGRNVSFCFKDGQNCLDGNKNQVHTRSLHAEENAMLQIAKYGGEGLKNGYLFTTASPCELCSKKAYQLGIKKIFFIDPYPGISNKHILKSGTDDFQPSTKLFVGAVGRAYHHLFEPFMPYKDELKIILNFKYVSQKSLKKTFSLSEDELTEMTAEQLRDFIRQNSEK